MGLNHEISGDMFDIDLVGFLVGGYLFGVFFYLAANEDFFFSLRMRFYF